MKKMVILIVCAGMLTACRTVEQQGEETGGTAKKMETAITEKRPPAEVGSVTDTTENGEDVFLSLLDEIESRDFYLHRGQEEILDELGAPMDKGWYEGAEYMKYDTMTYFIAPGTDTAETAAMQNPPLNQKEITKRLGDPDEGGDNKRDGLWTWKYHYEDGTIIVEKPEKSAEEIFCVWFQTAKQ